MYLLLRYGKKNREERVRDCGGIYVNFFLTSTNASCSPTGPIVFGDRDAFMNSGEEINF